MSDETQGPTPKPDLGDVVPFLTGLPKTYPNIFTKPGTAEWLLRNRTANGLAEYIRFLGRRAFISQRDFERWFRGRAA